MVELSLGGMAMPKSRITEVDASLSP